MVIYPAALDLPYALVEWVTMLIVTREGDRRCKLRPSQRAVIAQHALGHPEMLSRAISGGHRPRARPTDNGSTRMPPRSATGRRLRERCRAPGQGPLPAADRTHQVSMIPRTHPAGGVLAGRNLVRIRPPGGQAWRADADEFFSRPTEEPSRWPSESVRDGLPSMSGPAFRSNGTSRPRGVRAAPLARTSFRWR